MPRSPCACHLLLLLLLLPLSCCFLFLSISIRYPYSVTCIISVSGTRPYIDILERCNGKLRISISWHKLPASPPLLPYPHYPLGCHALTLCALCSDLFRFASISFRFVLVCFAAVLSVFHLRVAAASGKAFPLRLPLLFHFPFRSSQFATFASDRSCLCHVESGQSVHFLCVAQCLNAGGTQLPLLQAS